MDDINPNPDEYYEQRALRGDRAAFERAMAKVPDVVEACVDTSHKESGIASNQTDELGPS